MPSRLRLLLVLLLLPLSQTQRVESGFGKGHTYTYTAVLMLVIAASVPFTVVGSVMPFDEESMIRIGNSESPAFIRFDPVDCDSCEKLDDFWNMCGQHFPGLIWTADCEEVPAVCEMANVAKAPRGNVVDPVFMTWTGKVMEPYTGTRNPEALVAFIQKVAGDKNRGKKRNDAKVRSADIQGSDSAGQSGSSLLDPAHGLAPGLLADQARHAAQSRFHDKGDAPTTRDVHADKSVRLAWSPSLVHLPGFVDPETCAELIRIATPLLEPSQAAGTAKGRQLHRNSSSAMLGRQQELTNPLIRRLTERIHHLMNIPPDHGEGLQVARYLPGQSYGFHEDAFDGAPRAYTFLAYLNDCEGGGETIFPLLSANGSSGSVDPATFLGVRKTDPELMTSFCEGDAGGDVMRIQPKKGDAILFTPMRPWMQTDERALHGACRVTSGEKWVVQRWSRPVFNPSYTREYTQAFPSHGSREQGGSDQKRKLHEDL